MTEINSEPFIRDKEYLKDHYLCDIPGLSEYQENLNDDQKNEKKEDKEEEKKENEMENKDKELLKLKKEAKELGLNPDERKKEMTIFNENII